jgi:superfamily II RNA helicase
LEKPWQCLRVTTIALELERTLERLAPEKARVLESRVREAIFEVEKEKELPTLEEMKKRMPEFADVIGCWADVEFELPEDLPLPPAKTW